MLRSIIFDMDGVLVKSMELHADAWIEAFDGTGIEIDRQDIYDIEGSNDNGIIELMLKKAGLEPISSDFETIPAKKRRYFKADRVDIFDDIDTCLRSLKERYLLAVVSGSDRDAVEAMMESFFPGIFDVIVTGCDIERGKPAPDPYEKAVEMLGLQKEQCMVVENAPMGSVPQRAQDSTVLPHPPMCHPTSSRVQIGYSRNTTLL